MKIILEADPPGGSLATYCTTHARVHTFKMDPKWRKPRANLVEKHTLNGVNRVKKYTLNGVNQVKNIP